MRLIALDTETTGLDTFSCDLLGLSWAEGEKQGWITKKEEIRAYLEEVKDEYLVFHNGKFDCKVIYNTLGIELGCTFDTKLAYNLLDIEKSAVLEDIIQEVFKVKKKKLLDIYNEYNDKSLKSLPSDWFTKIDQKALGKYAMEDVEYTLKIYHWIQEQFKERLIERDWMRDVEGTLGRILTQTELKGVEIDPVKLKAIEDKAVKQRDFSENVVRFLADDKDLNVNSSKQLAKVLFDDLKLKSTKKTKTGAKSTDSATLEKMKNQHGIISHIMKYKELGKLINSFTSPLLERSKEGAIHGTFNQMGTKTRRFSCSEPNLQQIPAKTKLGQEVRACFVPRKGYKFLVADYSQIELRILAHFSQDEQLMKAFHEGLDLHQHTASLMNDIPFDEVTKAQRGIGKQINFSIIYGKTIHGFAQDWNCTKEYAQKELDKWFNAYSGVKAYIAKAQRSAKRNKGVVKTLSGLQLKIRNVNSSNSYEQDGALRQAVNFPIQSSSQDILKKAVVDIYHGLKLYPLLLVHDELVYEIEEGGMLDKTVEGVLQYMREAWSLDVPLEVGYEVADHWTK